ncbi:pre-toxin TG domain-containing protein [Lysinibacillus xylanilyticus]|uniref:pre-toxin TG domain-containing protein n=1 Tax=Lysinibacillus xylanilyticus TaxID=582475 RepID=UPI003CFFE030
MATKKAVKKATKTVVKQTKAAAKTIKKAAVSAGKNTKQFMAKTGAKITNAYNSFKEGGWKGVTSAVVDFIPVVGNAKALYESATGKDPITGRKLSKAERAISASSGTWRTAVKGLKHGGKAVMKIATDGNKSNKVNRAATTKPKVQESSASQGKVAQEHVKGTGNSIHYAESGGRNISPEQFFKEEAIAEEMYEKFRGLGTEDVNAIANNTGFSITRVQRIKDHVFNNSHIKDHGVGRFDPDYELAQAWQRLMDGKQLDSDIQLLHHEIFES